MKKNGFTLVELLAVSAILAILVIIAMPNVLEMFNKAKVDAFETEVQSHVKAVANEFIMTGKLVYSNVASGAAKLPMDGEELDYYIELDTKGNIKVLNVTNGDYKIVALGTSDNPVKVEQIGDTIKTVVAESGESFTMNGNGVITGGGNTRSVITFYVGNREYTIDNPMTIRNWLLNDTNSASSIISDNNNPSDLTRTNVLSNAGAVLGYEGNWNYVYLDDVIYDGMRISTIPCDGNGGPNCGFQGQ